MKKQHRQQQAPLRTPTGARIGALLRAAREQQGRSAFSVAKEAEVAHPTVARVEDGFNATAETVHRIARVLGVRVVLGV